MKASNFAQQSGRIHPSDSSITLQLFIIYIAPLKFMLNIKKQRSLHKHFALLKLMGDKEGWGKKEVKDNGKDAFSSAV